MVLGPPDATLDEMRTNWTSTRTYDERVDELFVNTQIIDLCEQFRSGDVIAGGTGRDAFQTCPFFGFIGDLQPNERSVGGRQLALDDDFDVAIGETISADVTDNDLLGGSFYSIELVQPTNHGELEFNSDGTFTYTQTTYGRDSFQYRLSGSFPGEVATVNIVTEGLPLLPDDAVLETSNTGLEYFDFNVGTGDMPTESDTVEAEYVGYLPDGTIFDSNDSATFGLPQLIDGFSEGVQGMTVGGYRRLIIPPALGYGPDGNPVGGIGGTDIIVFDVRLLDIV